MYRVGSVVYNIVETVSHWYYLQTLIASQRFNIILSDMLVTLYVCCLFSRQRRVNAL